MPELKPFTGVRYRSADPALVTCPPYDVISPGSRARLIALHDHNFVRLILPTPTPDGYASAAAELRDWLADGTLRRDESSAYYLYRTDYEVRGRRVSTAGIVGALALQNLDGGGVLPHERTMPGPKADRLELMRHTRANLEPLWFVGSSHLSGLEEAIEAVSLREPDVEAADSQKSRHRLWRIQPREAEAVVVSVGASEIIIADGHHRYETALTYREERRAADGPGPWDFTLALIAGRESHAPTLLPIHRVATGMAVESIEAAGSLIPFRGNLQELADYVAAHGPGMIGVARGGSLWTMPTVGDLDAVFLADRILEPAHAQVSYVHDLREVAGAVERGATGFLLAAVSLQTVIDHALAGKRMPPKTTLFWPKPRSGLVFRLLDLPPKFGSGLR